MNENDLSTQLRAYGDYHDEKQEPVGIEDIRSALPRRQPTQIVTVHQDPRPVARGVAIAGAVGVAILLVVGGAVLLSRSASTFAPASEPVTTANLIDDTTTRVLPPEAPTSVDASGVVENFSTTTPDFVGAVLGDDGLGPLPLGVVNELPGLDYLDFLFEFCHPECYRDAHFMDPDNPSVGSGPWTSGRPFHVRHGFINDGDQPLGDGFDVAMYVTLWDGSPEAEAQFLPGQTYRFASDYVMRGTSDQCGPTYKTQMGPASCEWFVHDFPEGLPDGRYDLWAVWEAPCSAWVELGFTDSCSDPDAVVSFFSSGVNSPFGPFEPSFTEPNEA